MSCTPFSSPLYSVSLETLVGWIGSPSLLRCYRFAKCLPIWLSPLQVLSEAVVATELVDLQELGLHDWQLKLGYLALHAMLPRPWQTDSISCRSIRTSRLDTLPVCDQTVGTRTSLLHWCSGSAEERSFHSNTYKYGKPIYLSWERETLTNGKHS